MKNQNQTTKKSASETPTITVHTNPLAHFNDEERKLFNALTPEQRKRFSERWLPQKPQGTVTQFLKECKEKQRDIAPKILVSGSIFSMSDRESIIEENKHLYESIR